MAHPWERINKKTEHILGMTSGLPRENPSTEIYFLLAKTGKAWVLGWIERILITNRGTQCTTWSHAKDTCQEGQNRLSTDIGIVQTSEVTSPSVVPQLTSHDSKLDPIPSPTSWPVR